VRDCDVIVVGGGPAGAACAARLVAAGRDAVVLDRAEFPRLKLCAGWITPEVLADLGMNPGDYPHRFNTFSEIVAHVKGLTFKLRDPQHSIRRFEFDAWLLARSGAEVVVHRVRDIAREGGAYVVDGAFRAPYLVGAGGTRCPVYRTLFRAVNPKAKSLQAATMEHEFPYQWHDPRCHLWFLEKGLPGYGWYVPKADGYLNIGVGGMAEQLKRRGTDIKHYWRVLLARLSTRGLLRSPGQLAPKGYSYYLRGDVSTVRMDNAYIAGDAAGLATRDLCEGIGPAVRSGQRVAESILNGSPYRLDDIHAYSSSHPLVRRALEYLFVARSERAVHRRP